MTLTFQPHEVPDSLVARWDARWKLSALVLTAFSFSVLTQLTSAAAALALGIVLVIASRFRRRWVRNRLGLFAVAALPFLLVLPVTLDLAGPGWNLGPVRISERGLTTGLAVFCRCLAIGCLALVLLGTAPLHHSLAAAHRLKVPGVLVLLCGLAYRYAFLLAEELRRVRIALRTRGFRMRANGHGYRTVGHIVGAALVRGADRAERVAEAMRCRGFDGTFRTTITFRTTSADFISFLLLATAAAALVLWDRLELS